MFWAITHHSLLLDRQVRHICGLVSQLANRYLCFCEHGAQCLLADKDACICSRQFVIIL